MQKIGTIRVGTLYGFRKEENPEIADRDEGKFDVQISLKLPAWVKSDVFHTLTGNAISLGGYSNSIAAKVMHLNVEELHVISKMHDSIYLGKFTGSAHREVADSFTFCMSRCDAKEEIHGIFDGYDAHWYISKANVELFGSLMAKAIHKEIIRRHRLKDYVVNKSLDVGNFQVHFRFRPVIYRDRFSLLSALSQFDVDLFVDCVKNVDFIKPNSFRPEREFRFRFFVVSHGKEYPPLVNNIDIDAGEIFDLLI